MSSNIYQEFYKNLLFKSVDNGNWKPINWKKGVTIKEQEKTDNQNYVSFTPATNLSLIPQVQQVSTQDLFVTLCRNQIFIDLKNAESTTNNNFLLTQGIPGGCSVTSAEAQANQFRFQGISIIGPPQHCLYTNANAPNKNIKLEAQMIFMNNTCNPKLKVYLAVIVFLEVDDNVFITDENMLYSSILNCIGSTNIKNDCSSVKRTLASLSERCACNSSNSVCNEKLTSINLEDFFPNNKINFYNWFPPDDTLIPNEPNTDISSTIHWFAFKNTIKINSIYINKFKNKICNQYDQNFDYLVSDISAMTFPTGNTNMSLPYKVNPLFGVTNRQTGNPPFYIIETVLSPEIANQEATGTTVIGDSPEADMWRKCMAGDKGPDDKSTVVVRGGDVTALLELKDGVPVTGSGQAITSKEVDELKAQLVDLKKTLNDNTIAQNKIDSVIGSIGVSNKNPKDMSSTELANEIAKLIETYKKESGEKFTSNINVEHYQDNTETLDKLKNLLDEIKKKQKSNTEVINELGNIQISDKFKAAKKIQDDILGKVKDRQAYYNLGWVVFILIIIIFGVPFVVMIICYLFNLIPNFKGIVCTTIKGYEENFLGKCVFWMAYKFICDSSTTVEPSVQAQTIINPIHKDLDIQETQKTPITQDKQETQKTSIKEDNQETQQTLIKNVPNAKFERVALGGYKHLLKKKRIGYKRIRKSRI